MAGLLPGGPVLCNDLGKVCQRRKPSAGKPSEGKPSESKGKGEGKGEAKPGKPGEGKPTYVTVFDDVSPRRLIAGLLPDVLVKGGDYGLDEIHGREEVEAAGGEVISLPFVAGESTSTIIERMKRAKHSTE